MATKKKGQKKSPRKSPDASSEAEHRAPSGRGGVAMGRTVGLPFGGARARKRQAKATKRESNL
jgi:hypothetical protein